jgi:hypothetical protein
MGSTEADSPHPSAASEQVSGRRWLYLTWQKLPLPVYLLSVSRDGTRLCPRDILVGETRRLGESEILRLARMTLYPRSVGADAYLLPPHQRWRILKLRRVLHRADRQDGAASR